MGIRGPKAAAKATKAEQPNHITARLRKLRERAELSMEAIATACGYKTPSGYQRYESAELFTKPWLPVELVEKLEAVLVGKGDPLITADEVRELAGVARWVGQKLKVTDNVVDFAGTSYAAVGVWDIQVSAGHGAIVYDTEPEAFNLFRVDFLKNVSRAPLGMLAVIRVSGDSMANTLHNGDHVLVDRTINRIGRDGIYVIRLGAEDEIMVKRCTRDPRSKTLIIKADNPEYPTHSGVLDEDIQVLGRVVWLGRNVGG